MKKTLFILLFQISTFTYSQVAGNSSYQNQVSFSESDFNVGFNSNNDIVFDVKGLANLKADNYVAIFNITQVGKSTEEVNASLQNRISQITEKLKEKNIKLYVDMISFVPVYEYEAEKKVFSRKTYNEVPKGFELKKNLHIQYSDPIFLNELISICSENEVYDLVKVDYFSSLMETTKKELVAKSKLILKEKIKNFQDIITEDFSANQKQVNDGFKVIYPIERYQSYQAYNSTSLNFEKNSTINGTTKNTTLYYQPLVDKEFDFVINNNIVEPVIQIIYNLKVKIVREVETIKTEKEYLIITANGDLKEIKLSK